MDIHAVRGIRQCSGLGGIASTQHLAKEAEIVGATQLLGSLCPVCSST